MIRFPDAGPYCDPNNYWFDQLDGKPWDRYGEYVFRIKEVLEYIDTIFENIEDKYWGGQSRWFLGEDLLNAFPNEDIRGWFWAQHDRDKWLYVVQMQKTPEGWLDNYEMNADVCHETGWSEECWGTPNCGCSSGDVAAGDRFFFSDRGRFGHRFYRLSGNTLEVFQHRQGDDKDGFRPMKGKEVSLEVARESIFRRKIELEEVDGLVVSMAFANGGSGGHFVYEDFSYRSSITHSIVKGVRCFDPLYEGISHMIFPPTNGGRKPVDYICRSTLHWPPLDCEGDMQTGNPRCCYDDVRDRARDCLRVATDNPLADFREGQWEAIDGVLNGRRQLVVQRTGWGKSMIYFLAAKFLREQGRGMTLLISPLIALMRNQVAAADRVGVRCFTINSTNPKEWDGIREKILADAADLLIVSPERLANDSFRTTILEPITNKIGLLVVDEAHCVSDWGHDFRPDYKKISRLLEHLPRTVPVLATTATATNRVIADIEAQLGGEVQVSRGSLVRKSLFLQNIRLPSQEARLAWLAETLKSRIGGSGIVYTLTIRDAEIVSYWLRMNGVSAYAYCGKVLPPMDMDQELRRELEAREEWKSATTEDAKAAFYRVFLEDMLLGNRVKALVATSALSMGFDKSDLAFVIHYQRPKSVVDYYQQVGRAGRGIDSAYGVLLNGDEDDKIGEFFIRNAFPSEEDVQRVLKAIADAPEGLSRPELERMFNMKKGKIEQVLKFVMADTPQPIVKDGSKYRATPFVSSYRIPAESIAHLTQIRHQEMRTMDEYVKTSDCLMEFLCKALESPMEEERCNRCRNCCPEQALPSVVDAAVEQVAADLLRKSSVPIRPRKQWADPVRAAARFGLNGKVTIPPELRMEEGLALASYGAGEWGRLVRKGKYETQPPRFDDRLIEACAKMVSEWHFEKMPQWIVPVPSRRNNALVGDFADRLSRRLGLPCWHGLVKTADTPPQKNMENSAFQQNNVIDAFSVEGTLPEGGCLLVDDMVDSKWTFTVAAAVLRRAGANFVVPLALADSSNDGE